MGLSGRQGPFAARSVGWRFAIASDGIAILEFALILPVLLLLYVGTVELTTLMRHSRKVDLLSRTVGDLVGHRIQPTAAEMADIFQSARLVLSPFDSDGVQMTVSAVGVGGDQDAGPLRICSSASAANSPIRTPGEAAPVPSADSIQVAGTRLILVEIAMTYRPVTGNAVFKDLAGFVLSRKTLWPVRNGRRYTSQSPEVLLPLGLPCPLR